MARFRKVFRCSDVNWGFCIVLRSLESEGREFIILGDTNCDYRVILQESSVAILPSKIKLLEILLLLANSLSKISIYVCL